MSQSNMLFVNPELETQAVKTGTAIHHLLPIRVSMMVPKGEIWWARELPDVIEIDGNEVRSISRLEIIHKMKVTE